MDITYRIDQDILYLALEGRIDASNAVLAEEKIFNIKNDNAGKHIVIDADKLEYISSAGLRVILRLRKEEPKLAIINVAVDVYEVFDMTGFTDMVTIEKAYQRMSVDGCEVIAKGANGAVYRYDDETILKVYFAKDSLPGIKQERENARRAFVLGINTAIPYGIVRVGDGYGTVTELLNAVSVTKLIRANPDDLTEAVNYYVDMLKNIHAIEVEDGFVPDIRESVLAGIDSVEGYLPEDQVNKLRALIEAVPKQNTLLHGDYHTNNIMIQNGEPLLIDLDTLCMGHAIFELGAMFSAFIGYAEFDHQNAMDFFGFSFETSEKFWELSLQKYLGSADEEYCRTVAEKAMVIGYLRILRRSIRRFKDAESPARIARCQEMLAKLLAKIDTLTF
jgi:uncharacterized protein (TIGR02172 family)